MPVTLRLISGGLSDVGRKRDENEDRILIDSPRGIYLVVDGIGGHAAGEQAARIATDIIQLRLSRQTGSPEKRVREAFALASTEIFDSASRDPDLTGMACVATLALVEDHLVTVAHVGDSRLYLLEPGKMRKVTRDHSPVGEMEDAGQLTEVAAQRHPRRNEVYRDLGSAPHAPDDPDFVEVHHFHLPAASALLLCSDGLTDQVLAEDIRRLVERHAEDPDAGALALVTAANEAGGKDNVSVILVETPQYAMLSEQPDASHPANSTVPWRSFLLGLLAALAVFGALRPYVVETISGKHLRLGTVKPPRNWLVGSAGIATISEALDRAGDGDTISVAPGEYHETLHLRSGVSLVSLEKYAAKILAPDVAVVADNVHRARISGFDIPGPGEVGIRIVQSDLDITNVRVSGMTRAGVDIDGGSSSLQASVIDQNSGIGIYVHGVSNPEIGYNMITNNGHGSEPLPGVSIAGSATPHLVGNVISNSGAEQVWVSPLFNEGNLRKENVLAPTLHEGDRDLRVITR